MSKKLVFDHQVPLYGGSFSEENLDNFISSLRDRISKTVKLHGLENKIIEYHYFAKTIKVQGFENKILDYHYDICINVYREETDKEYKNRLLAEEKKIKKRDGRKRKEKDSIRKS